MYGYNNASIEGHDAGELTHNDFNPLVIAAYTGLDALKGKIPIDEITEHESAKYSASNHMRSTT